LYDEFFFAHSPQLASWRLLHMQRHIRTRQDTVPGSRETSLNSLARVRLAAILDVARLKQLIAAIRHGL